MFWKKDNREAALEARIVELTDERARLRKEVDTNAETLRKHKLSMQVREDQIARDEKNLKHELALKEERAALAHAKTRMELESKHQTALHEVQTEYNKQAREMLVQGKKELTEQYNKLMERLPDINVALKGSLGG